MIRLTYLILLALLVALSVGCATVADSFQAAVNGADVQVMGAGEQVVSGADTDNTVIGQALVENKSWLTFGLSDPITGLPHFSLGHKRVLLQFIRTDSSNNADAHANDSAEILSGQTVTLGVGASVTQVKGDEGIALPARVEADVAPES